MTKKNNTTTNTRRLPTRNAAAAAVPASVAAHGTARTRSANAATGKLPANAGLTSPSMFQQVNNAVATVAKKVKAIPTAFFDKFGWPAGSSGIRAGNKLFFTPSSAFRVNLGHLSAPDKAPPPHVLNALGLAMDSKQHQAHKKAVSSGCNQRKRFYQKLKKLPVVPPELAIVLSRSESTKTEKEAALGTLIGTYSDLWQETFVDHRRGPSKPAAKAKTKEQQEKEDSRNAQLNALHLRTGNKQHLHRNITPLAPGMPLQLGCLVNNLPISVMQALICQYGSPQTQQTFLGGRPDSPMLPIRLSETDDELQKVFVSQRKEVLGNNKRAPTEDMLKEAVLADRSLFEAASNVDGKVKESDEIALAAKFAYHNLMQKPYFQNIVRKKDTLEKLRYRILEKEFRDNENQSSWKEYLHYYLWTSWGMDAWFLRQFRTKYCFHHWFIYHGTAGNKGSEFEPHEIVAMGHKDPLDCPTLSEIAVAAYGQLHKLVTDVMALNFVADVQDVPVTAPLEQNQFPSDAIPQDLVVPPTDAIHPQDPSVTLHPPEVCIFPQGFSAAAGVGGDDSMDPLGILFGHDSLEGGTPSGDGASLDNGPCFLGVEVLADGAAVAQNYAAAASGDADVDDDDEEEEEEEEDDVSACSPMPTPDFFQDDSAAAVHPKIYPDHTKFAQFQDNMAFFPGVIKSGCCQLHQRLHIDNKDLLGSSLLRKVVLGQYSSIGDYEWAQGGYFIDLPLSVEGSWLRIAKPNPMEKRFDVEMVFVPFGSCLIRSAALFHSGHYGSPGNTRVHVLMFPNGCRTNTKSLGYLSKLTESETGCAAGWDVLWDPQVPRNFQTPNSCTKFMTDDTKLKIERARDYYKLLAQANYTGQAVHFWMLNPTINCEKVAYSNFHVGFDFEEEDPGDIADDNLGGGFFASAKRPATGRPKAAPKKRRVG